jgi:two-component system cell cycle sensor histidine kinase/response regulator CckA
MPQSKTAQANLKLICEEHLEGTHHIEVIDLLKNPQLSKCDQIVAIPTLVRRLPAPVKKISRNFSNRDSVRTRLNLAVDCLGVSKSGVAAIRAKARCSREPEIAEPRGDCCKVETPRQKQDPHFRDLIARLEEAEETLSAIRDGEADAIIVSGLGGERVLILEDVEHRHRLFFESMKEGAVTLLPEGNIAFCNRRFEEMVRMEQGRAVGSPLAYFLTPEQATILKSVLERSEAESSPAELMLRASDGTQVPIQLVVRGISERQGGGFCLLITDLTEQRKKEYADSFLAAIAESSEGPIISTTLNGTIVSWNRGAERLYGYAAEEIIGRPLRGLLPASKSDEAHEILERVCKGETVKQVETKRVGKYGQLIDVSLTAMPIHDAEGNLTGVCKIVHDITERKQVERALRESEERLRLITETITEVFWIATPDISRVLFVSPGYERVWRRTRTSLYDNPRSFLDSVHSDDRERVAAVLSVQLAGEPFEHEYRIHQPEGSVRWIWDRGFPVRDDAGHLTCYVGVAQDITGRKQLENQLRQSQKMEAIGQLAGGVAHDFNNLLTIISGYGELVFEQLPEGDPLRVRMASILKAAQTATSLTRQLLAFSRQQILTPRVLDLNHVVAEMHSMLERLIGENIELSTIPAPGLGEVKADPVQIEQILLNLSVNSRDAMPTGGKLIIETANVELDQNYAQQHIPVTRGSYVMLSVSDTGTGMDSETQKRVFEPFFTTKEKGHGTGLGLSTVYGIVKQSGGYIWIYSELGRGTTFKVYLPRIDEPENVADLTTRPKNLSCGTESILFVDDSESIRKLGCEVLEARGYHVLKAENGAEALRIAQEHPGTLHLLLTDLVMPGISGRVLAERMTELRPDIKVLYLSGYTDDTIVRHGEIGPNMRFFQKPFTPDALARRVREVLDTP